jgi:hypothetical protein
MNFEETYSKSSDDLKIRFLDESIMVDEKLRQKFMTFIRSQEIETPGLSFNKFLEMIQVVRADCKEQFEMVDLENPDWDNYRPPVSGYIEEWEAYQYASEQEFELIFKKFRSEAVNKIIGQRPEELLAMLIGLYEAIQDADIPDEVGSFEDVNEFLLSEYTSTMNELIGKIRVSIVPERKIFEAVELFFRYGDRTFPGNTEYAKCFEHFLISLAEQSDQAERLLTLLDSPTFDRKALPELVLVLNKKSGNMGEWLQSARQFYSDNEAVARQLLEYYFVHEKDAFVKTACELFAADHDLWAEFLQKYITPELDRELFVKVFRQLTVNEKKIKHYNKIREYLSSDDFNNLVKELEWDKVFVVKLLEAEKQYDRIKGMVEKSADDWKYAEMIEPILTVYPEFCFRSIRNRAVISVENQRGRHAYERIAAWLSLTREIPGFENEKRELVRQIYNHKPNLPALKDEMRRAGLMEWV